MELSASKYGINGIHACLSARADTLLAKTLENKRPSYENCTAEEKKIADYLIDAGWMTRYPNGNLQLLTSKKSQLFNGYLSSKAICQSRSGDHVSNVGVETVDRSAGDHA